MVLVDTCIWVDFYRFGDTEMGHLLWKGEVVTHWIVIGELATGNLKDRAETLHDLRALEQVQPATEREALALIENQKLYGRGLSWNDIQLLASSLIHHVPLWTRDQRLREAADHLHAAWQVA